MAFFYNETRASGGRKAAAMFRPQDKRDMPIATLRLMGCDACPRNNDEMQSPKMEPSGNDRARVYLLGAQPSEADDAGNNHWLGKVGAEVYDKFAGLFLADDVRSNYITQCLGEQTKVSMECCRGRVVSDIESCRPLIVVTVGDEALRWALGISSDTALTHRGTFFATKIGKHKCFVYPVASPRYVSAKTNYRKSEHEIALEYDVEQIQVWLRGNHVPPDVHSDIYDKGITCITGAGGLADLALLELKLQQYALLPSTAVDIETNRLRPYATGTQGAAHIWTASIGTYDNCVAFPLDHPDGWGTDTHRRKAWELVGTFLLESRVKYAHNESMELEWFNYFYGPTVVWCTDWGDTLCMAHTLDERMGTKSLDMQTRINFGFFLKEQSRVNPVRLLEYPILEALRYNALDTKWTHKLSQSLLPKLHAHKPYFKEYERKVRLGKTLVITEAQGMPVNMRVAEDKRAPLDVAIRSAERKVQLCKEVIEYTQRFGTFSASSPDHVLKLLKDVCRRPEVRVEDRRTGAVSWSTGEELLASIPAEEVPAASLVLELRGLSKVLDNYILPVTSRRIVCADDQIRCKYTSTTAVTGRLASEDPNLQNWPKRKNKHVRQIIAPWGKDEVVLSCDYGQIEFRVAGMASEDENLVKYCWTTYDVHKYWAERMVEVYPRIIDLTVKQFGIDWDEVGIKTLRQEAKNKWVFPQIFGAATESCAAQLQLPSDVAKKLGAEFWDELKGVKRWQDKLVERYIKTLYVETLGGRRRRGAMSKQEIINTPIQGTAADIVTEAMCALSERAFMQGLPQIQPRLNVHDDLTFISTQTSLQKNIAIIAEEMCKPRFSYINVPLVVEVSTGRNWADLKEIAVYRSDVLFNTPNPYK